MKIKDCEIIKQLGHNHNQNRVTFLASDSKGKLVLKQFTFQSGNTWEQYTKLEKEFTILKKLNHPNIPKYIGNYQEEKACYLLQEYIDAPNLEGKKLAWAEVVIIARQILDILKYLSSQGIVHKDIKPANILWNGDIVYLVDFGFSTDLQFSPGVSSTFLGTPGYMPPEQVFQGRISLQGDLYSLGITLFSLLSGIEDKELVDVFDDDFNLKVDLLQCDNLFGDWLRKLTANSPKKRYLSAEQASDELAKFITGDRAIQIELEDTSPKPSDRETEFAAETQTINFGKDYPLPQEISNTGNKQKAFQIGRLLEYPLNIPLSLFLSIIVCRLFVFNGFELNPLSVALKNNLFNNNVQLASDVQKLFELVLILSQGVSTLFVCLRVHNSVSFVTIQIINIVIFFWAFYLLPEVLF